MNTRNKIAAGAAITALVGGGFFALGVGTYDLTVTIPASIAIPGTGDCVMDWTPLSTRCVP